MGKLVQTTEKRLVFCNYTYYITDGLFCIAEWACVETKFYKNMNFIRSRLGTEMETLPIRNCLNKTILRCPFTFFCQIKRTLLKKVIDGNN